MKTFLQRSVLGILFGSFLTIVITFSIIYFGNNDVLDSALLMKNAAGSIFCGWFFTVTPMLFENENLTLPVQTALHFICVTVLYFIIAFFVGWIPFTVKGFLGILSIFIIMYVLIWLAFYMYFRKQAASLNEELNQL